jgi:hypothetical protein
MTGLAGISCPSVALDVEISSKTFCWSPLIFSEACAQMARHYLVLSFSSCIYSCSVASQTASLQRVSDFLGATNGVIAAAKRTRIRGGMSKEPSVQKSKVTMSTV